MNYEAFARRCAATRHRIQTRFPAVALVPAHWMPRVFRPAPAPSLEYLVYREANRPFRRAFRGVVGGERERKILGACGEARLRGAR